MKIKNKLETLVETSHSRRKFLTTAGKMIAFFSALPILNFTGKKAHARPVSGKKTKVTISADGWRLHTTEERPYYRWDGEEGF